MRRTNCEPEFGRILRKRRLELNLKQSEVSAAVGWRCPEMLSLVEHGQRYPRLDTIPDLAAALALDAEELCVAVLRETAPRFLASLELKTTTEVSEAA